MLSTGLKDTRLFHDRLEPSDMVSDLSASELRPSCRSLGTESNFQQDALCEVRKSLMGMLRAVPESAG